MRILGIDPGFARLGWGVIDSQGQKNTVIAYDCLETKAGELLENRLVFLYEQMLQIIDTYKPEMVAVEDLFFNSNAKTALKVGHSRGVVVLVAGLRKLPVHEYTPLQVKMALTGYGRADKAQIGHMVKTLLRLTQMPKLDDTSDALAIAMTHAFSAKMVGRMK